MKDLVDWLVWLDWLYWWRCCKGWDGMGETPPFFFFFFLFFVGGGVFGFGFGIWIQMYQTRPEETFETGGLFLNGIWNGWDGMGWDGMG